MADEIGALELADFLLIVSAASEVPIESIWASDQIFIDSEAALVPHRKAIQDGAAIAEVLTVLGASIMKKQPAPRLNVVAAMMAIDELVFLNGCQWSNVDIATELERRLVAVDQGAHSLTDLASWLDSLLAC